MEKGFLICILLLFFLIPIVNAEAPWPFFNGNLQHTGLSPYDTTKINGAIKWTFETGDGIESSPTIDDNGTIYFGSHDGYLYALNSDGTLKWKFKAGNPVYNEQWKRYSAILSSPAIGKDGKIYIISPDDFLHAVKGGNEVWKFPLKWDAIDFWASAMVGNDGTIYVGAARNRNLSSPNLISAFYAINSDGTERWHYEISAGVTSAPALANDGTIYINGNVEGADKSTTEAYLFALTSDGKLKWKFKMQDWVESSPSVGNDGIVYTGSKEGKVYALNSDGTLKWKFSANDGIDGTPAIGKDGTIYVGSWDNNFYALNPNGTLKWSYEVEPGFETIGASAAIGADGTIYFGTTKGFFYALYPNGTKKWEIANMGSVASSPAIGKDETIYIGAWDKKMYAIGEGVVASSVNNSTDCHEKQLARMVQFEKNPENTCIDGTCDSTSTICQKKNFDGSCDAPIQACVSSNCKTIRSYCNLLIKNTEQSEGYTVNFKENYITKDGQVHFLKEMSAFLLPGQWRTIFWQYEVDANNVGYCDYSDLGNLVCEKKSPYDNKVTWNFTDNKSNAENSPFAGENRAPIWQEILLRAILPLTLIIGLIAGIIGVVIFIVKKKRKKFGR